MKLNDMTEAEKDKAMITINEVTNLLREDITFIELTIAYSTAKNKKSKNFIGATLFEYMDKKYIDSLKRQLKGEV